MPRIVHFEISANDPEKVVAFYREVFGWEINKWNGPQEYWLVRTGDPATPGIDGGILRAEGPFTTTVNTIDVPDIEECIERIKQRGGQVVMARHAIPGVGYQAYCKDVEGTLFGLHQTDPSAH